MTRGLLQREIRVDKGTVDKDLEAPLLELFDAFSEAAGGAGGEVAAMVRELRASPISYVLLRLKPGESEDDYGGATMLHFWIGKQWRSIMQMTGAEWRSLPKDARAMFTLTLRHTAKRPIAGKTDMHHWYTLIHEVGAHMVPLWKLVKQTRSGAVQKNPPTAEAVRSGEFGEATHHHQIAHGESPSFKALYEASQLYVSGHVEGADLEGLWESHEDDEAAQLLTPLIDDYTRVMSPMEDEVTRLGKLVAAQDAVQIVAAQSRLRTALPPAVARLKSILAHLRTIHQRKRRPAPPPPPPPPAPSAAIDDEPPASPALPIPRHLLPPLPAIVLPTNSPWGWRDEKLRAVTTNIETVEGAIDLLERYIAQLGAK